MAATQEYDEEVSLRDMISKLWAQRGLILTITALTTLVAGIVPLITQKKYQAMVVISPVSQSASSNQLSTLSSLTSQFSGLASLMGVSGAGDSKKSESLAVLQSEELTESYIEKNDLLKILYKKQWDPAAKKWKTDDPEKMPTLWKANQYFKKKVRSVVTDTKTGLVTLSITWTDPHLAAKWANDLVRLTNDFLRDQAIEESERNIAYLNEQAAKTDVVGVKQGIYTILQNEINKAMLARGSAEYALKVLDPAFVPESPSGLGLPIMLIIGFFGGGAAGIFVAFVRNAWRNGSLDRPSMK